MIERLDLLVGVLRGPGAVQSMRQSLLRLRLPQSSGPGGKIEVNMFFFSSFRNTTELKGFAV